MWSTLDPIESEPMTTKTDLLDLYNAFFDALQSHEANERHCARVNHCEYAEQRTAIDAAHVTFDALIRARIALVKGLNEYNERET